MTDSTKPVETLRAQLAARLVQEDAARGEQLNTASDPEHWRARFAPMPRATLAREWPDALVKACLPAATVDAIVRQVVQPLLGVGIRSLNKDLKDARGRAADAERKAARDARSASLGTGRIRIEHTGIAAAAREVMKRLRAELPTEKLFVFGGRLARVVEERMPDTHTIDKPGEAAPAVHAVSEYNEANMRREVEGVVQTFVRTHYTMDGQYEAPIDTPPALLADLLEGDPDQALPRVLSLSVHPVVTPDGRVVSSPGFDPGTQLLLVGKAPPRPIEPLTREEAAAALRQIEEAVFGEFEFAACGEDKGKLNRTAAVAALLTVLQRKVMDQSCALLARASRQSSGKTTLARLIHVIATGRDMPVTTMATDETEMQKRMLSMLMRQPEMICIDNVPDGYKLYSAVVAQVLSSGTFSQRVLGASKDLVLPTLVAIFFTGNNTRLGNDEAQRFLTIDLDPKTDKPENRDFKHSDVVARGRELRDEVLRLALGIVAGFLKAHPRGEGFPVDNNFRFKAWDTLVRRPLMWAGGADVTKKIAAEVANNEDALAAKQVIETLQQAVAANADKAPAYRVFDNPFTVSQVIAYAGGDYHKRGAGGLGMDGNPTLREGLAALGGKDLSSTVSVGRVLKAICGRKFAFDDGHRRWIAATRTPNNSAAYRLCSEPVPVDPPASSVEAAGGAS